MKKSANMRTNKNGTLVYSEAMKKEDKEMKKFEINGVEYRFNEETGRYSKSTWNPLEGKSTTKRISKAEYEEAANKPVNAKTIPSENGEHAVVLAKIGAGYGIKFVGEDEFKPFDKSEFKSECDPRDRGNGRFEITFEFMGRKYWLKDAVEKEVKKTSRKRAPKNVAYRNDDLEVTMTEKQLDFCKHLPDTCFWELGLESAPWIDVLCDEIGGQFAGKPMTIGAMVSTLREKGIINVSRDESRQGKPKFLTLTDLGKKIFTELNIGC